jgi:hypothetical protein
VEHVPGPSREITDLVASIVTLGGSGVAEAQSPPSSVAPSQSTCASDNDNAVRFATKTCERDRKRDRQRTQSASETVIGNSTVSAPESETT